MERSQRVKAGKAEKQLAPIATIVIRGSEDILALTPPVRVSFEHLPADALVVDGRDPLAVNFKLPAPRPPRAEAHCA